MSSSTRTVVCQESGKDNTLLKTNHYNFNIAKSCASAGGGESYTIIWQSKNQYQPNTSVTWQVNYAFNWTLDLPTSGVAVTLGGNWKACEKGESLDISSIGEFTSSQVPIKDKNSLQIGKNNYGPLHIVVGVDPGNGVWEAIWVDPDVLLDTGNYTPIEHAKVWWQEGTASGTMISAQESTMQLIDLTSRNSQTGTFLEYVHWNSSLTPPDWDPVSEIPFQLSFFAPKPINGNGSHATNGGVVTRQVRFQWSITSANRPKVSALIQAALSELYDPVSVTVQTGQLMLVTVGSLNGTMPMVAAIDASIDRALTEAATSQSQLFPANLSWNIDDAPNSLNAPQVDIVRFIRFVVAVAGNNQQAILNLLGNALRAYFRNPSLTLTYTFTNGSTVSVKFSLATSVTSDKLTADDYTAGTQIAINSVLGANPKLFPSGEAAKVTSS